MELLVAPLEAEVLLRAEAAEAEALPVAVVEAEVPLVVAVAEMVAEGEFYDQLSIFVE